MHKDIIDIQAPGLENSAEFMKTEMAILTEVARTRLDELLTAEDYKKFGLGEVNPIEQEDFEWSVYVKDYNGRKSVGIKILDEKGIYDIREFDLDDQSLSISTKQNLIDEIAKQRSEKIWKLKERTGAELKERMNKERGFPEGSYVLNVTYPHRSGSMRTVAVTEIEVRTNDTREEVLHNAKGWIQLHGFHNFGLDFSKDADKKAALVKAVLKQGDIEVPFSCAVDSSGFIVKD